MLTYLLRQHSCNRRIPPQPLHTVNRAINSWHQKVLTSLMHACRYGRSLAWALEITRSSEGIFPAATASSISAINLLYTSGLEMMPRSVARSPVAVVSDPAALSPLSACRWQQLKGKGKIKQLHNTLRLSFLLRKSMSNEAT